MSIDTSEIPVIAAGAPLTDWKAWCQGKSHGKSKTAHQIHGDAAKGGGIYRWGVSVARMPLTSRSLASPSLARMAVADREFDSLHDSLSRIASEAKHPEVDWRDLLGDEATQSLIDLLQSSVIPTPLVSAATITWAAALPGLKTFLDESTADSLVPSLIQAMVQFHQAILTRDEVSCTSHLMIGGELGLTLAWRFPGFPQAKQIAKNACTAIDQWCESSETSLAAAIEGATDARLVLASLIRCRGLMRSITKQEFTTEHDVAAESLATWVATLTGVHGISALSLATAKDVKDDTATSGLLQAARQLSPDALTPAIRAALGVSQTGGRLAWEVALPEPMACDETAKLAVLLPEWDVRRGRTHVDFRGQEVSVEIFSGRARAIAGEIQTTIEVDGVSQESSGPWEEICRYSDDDVHYLELEQPWTQGWTIERQFLLIREERCLLFADAVIPQTFDAHAEVQYCATFPISSGVSIQGEEETTDLFLRRAIDGKPDRDLALVMPLSASEWKKGATAARLSSREGDRMTLTARDSGRLYAPLWMDFQRRRFQRKRTWRKLTVGDALNLVPTGEAAAFRIQVGSEQWVIYRSLGDQRCRTFLGKHLMADFYVSRFDTGDGSHDALITVDDREEAS